MLKCILRHTPSEVILISLPSSNATIGAHIARRCLSIDKIREAIAIYSIHRKKMRRQSHYVMGFIIIRAVTPTYLMCNFGETLEELE